jgi:hypothetical protein
VLTRWLAAFALTQAVEVPVILRAQPGRPWPRRLLVAFGGSALTHPIVWFVAPRVVPGGWVAMAIVAETFAVLAEAAWLRAFGVPRALWWSLLANALSAGIGLSIRAAFGWP